MPYITGDIHIKWKSNYFWADYHLGKHWGTVCVVMLPYNLLANGLAIIHPKTGNQENAFSYSANGEIRTHAQVQLETIAKSMHNSTETDDDSVTLDSSSELHNTRSNDDMDCTN